jgi:hypothetical protein
MWPRGHSCGHARASSFLAATSQTLVRAQSARGFYTRGIFLGESLSKVADVFDPYPTNIPFIRGACGTCYAPRLDGKIVWYEAQYLCSIVKRYGNGSAVFYIGFSK